MRMDINEDENMVEFLQNILYKLKLTTGKLKIDLAINILNRNGSASKNSRGGVSRSRSRHTTSRLNRSMIGDRRSNLGTTLDQMNFSQLPPRSRGLSASNPKKDSSRNASRPTA